MSSSWLVWNELWSSHKYIFCVAPNTSQIYLILMGDNRVSKKLETLKINDKKILFIKEVKKSYFGYIHFHL